MKYIILAVVVLSILKAAHWLWTAKTDEISRFNQEDDEPSRKLEVKHDTSENVVKIKKVEAGPKRVIDF